MSRSHTPLSRSFRSLTLVVLLVGASVFAVEPVPGEVVKISFPDLSPSLFTMFTGTAVAPTMAYRLPDNYDPAQRYPLLVYVPGYHGGPDGNIENARIIAGNEDWVIASLPLFKNSLDRDEIGRGILVGFDDYSALSKAYATMLGKLFELVPNVDSEQSAMVGFSNGALTVAVLVSNHDEFVLTHFKNFCLVDHGMFHLTDLHKKLARDCRYLILSGDKQSDPGRELKIRGGQLLQESWQMLGIDITFHVMKDTGHEFHEPHMALVGRWLHHEAITGAEIVSPVP